MGGGGSSFNWDASKLKAEVRKAEDKVSDAVFDTSLSEQLSQLLSVYNSRDNLLVNERLEEIKSQIGDLVESDVKILLGGSVAKHTYVDGFSDIDTLMILNDMDIPIKNPQEVLSFLEGALKARLSDTLKVEHGRLAVTVTYTDGMEIQILPALKTENGIKVPAWKKDNGWSEIDPKAFSEKLTKVNADCGGKLIPTIKLIKAVNSTLPEEQQLSGYHIESLAIATFKGYAGPTAPAKMMSTFFEKAKDLVLTPIKDSTGHSIHVDDYLGPAQSAQREQASHLLNRISKRIRNANASGSQEQWQQLFDA